MGATRVIYPLGDKQSSVSVNNSDKKSSFLIQAWVESPDQKKTSDIIITPPLFIINPNNENALRMVYTAENTPDDRESLYWLNVKAIPSSNQQEVEGRNVLQLAILSKIKIFIRPRHLKMASVDAPSHLTFRREGNVLVINNPTPYFVTLVSISIGGKSVEPVMATPKGETRTNLVGGISGTLKFSTVNDYGAVVSQPDKIVH
ncbi:fimbrial chaperone protein [Salmonella enterica subsp. enterica serovar Choleraesuis]|nr:fimbrial chaperone protein [Salmonella enterica subsp. enterica serovar Choleraesuis]